MHNERNLKLARRLEAEGIDALLVTSLPNIFYLCGFTGSTAKLLITPTQRWILTDFRYHEQVKQQVHQSYTLVDNTGKKLLTELVPELAKTDGFVKIGFESAHVNHELYAQFESTDGFEFVPTLGWVEELRRVKDTAEIKMIKASVLLNERVFTELLPLMNENTTEADIAAEISARALRYGASKISFDPIVASGDHGAKPHAGFTTRKLVPGTPLTIDMGLILDGYCSDMTRTVFYKDCPKEWEDVYNTVRSAKDLAQQAVMPGRIGKEIDAVARDYIYSHGYEGYFGHGLGHGVGIEVHETPNLSQLSEMVLEPGHVVTDEPGIYLPGKGGVRIEDMLYVTDEGCENLNELDTDIKVVG